MQVVRVFALGCFAAELPSICHRVMSLSFYALSYSIHDFLGLLDTTPWNLFNVCLVQTVDRPTLKVDKRFQSHYVKAKSG